LPRAFKNHFQSPIFVNHDKIPANIRKTGAADIPINKRLEYNQFLEDDLILHDPQNLIVLAGMIFSSASHSGDANSGTLNPAKKASSPGHY
jgi:hypothetical protein